MALEHLDWQKAANDNRRVCPICDGEVTGHRTKKYCGKACARKAEALVRDYGAERSRRLDAAQEQDCEECGATFKGIQKEGKPLRFCSKTCAGEAMALANRPIAQRNAVTFTVYRPLCECCGIRFDAPTSISRLCSAACKAEGARQRAREYFAANNNRDRSPRPCAECGIEFSPEYGNKRNKYCSDPCSKRATRRIAKGVRKARMRSTRVEPVNPIAVFDRDGWTCQLCGVDTPRELRGTMSDAAPELDHIVPLSKGGAHTYDNTQCACRKCNLAKSDTLPMAA